MPTVAELERLRALVERLTPLTQFQRGDLIRAQDWNDVVSALLDVARATLADNAVDAPLPAHEHPDQVKMSWLEPSLRALIERGPLSDPAATGKLDDLGRRLGRQQAQLDEIASGARETRTRVADIATRDLARQGEITAVRRTIDAIDARRDDVLALRASLESIRKDVSLAVDVAGRLQVNGQPVDIGVFDQRLRTVEELRQRLLLPAGDLLDAGRLEQRLTELSNTLVTQAQLTDALNNRPIEVPDSALAGLRDSLQTSLRSELEAVVNARAGDVRGELNTRFAQVDALVARAVSDAAPGLRDAAVSAIRPEITAAVSGAVAQLQVSEAANLASAVTGLRQELDGAIANLSGDVGKLVDRALVQTLTPRVDALQENLAALQKSTQTFDQRLSAQESSFGTLATRVEVVARTDSEAREELRRSLLQEMDNRGRLQTVDFDKRVSELQSALQKRLDSSIVDAQRGILESVQRTAAEAAAAEVRVLSTRLRGELVAIASDQVAALRGDLRTVVSESVTSAMRALPGVVSQEVRLATANLAQLVRSEITAATPNIRNSVVAELTTRAADTRLRNPPVR